MKFLDNIISQLPEYNTLQKAVSKGNCAVAATGLTGIHKAHIINSLPFSQKMGAFVVVSEEHEAQVLVNDLLSMGKTACFYPMRDFIFRDINSKSREYEHQRINVLCKIINNSVDVVVTTIDALAQYTIPPSVLKQAAVTMKSGTEISVDNVIKALTLNGYERTDLVEGAGQFAQRGGIIDLFMPDMDKPVRVEFWGDEIDTINTFDIETQRRIDYVEEITITPSVEVLIQDKFALAQKIEEHITTLRGKNASKAKEILQTEADNLSAGVTIGSIDKFIGLIYEKNATLLDYVSDRMIFISEQTKVKARQTSFYTQYNAEIKDNFAMGTLCKGFEEYCADKYTVWGFFENHTTVFLDNFTHGSYELKLKELVTFTAKQLSLWSGSYTILKEELNMDFNSSVSMVILAGTAKSASSLQHQLEEDGYPALLVEDITTPAPNNIYVMSGTLSAGFEYPSAKFKLLSHGTVFAPIKKKKPTRPKNAQQIYSLEELSVGDYVVHTKYGIGVYRGINKMENDGVIKDYITIQYAKDDELFVPVTQLDMVSKYIGPKEDNKVKLSNLGGSDWAKAKSRVRSAVKDIAHELTKLYAQRMKAKGYAFSQDSEWHHDFAAHFEYEETTDQLRCIDEITNDMERVAPMDRLLCGDVGFGKTEVALRAAFKCVADSKQCALLCPTTILAWQHFQTALRRFEGFPVKIELLSRFRTPAQQAEIIKQLKTGEVDMVIGTHRLISKDVKFRDLGLVIIDEEQRFGVAQKEKFKELCQNIDVLTLSATPIPRTLNMAMSGIRDMSVLEEAPQDRQPVQSYVMEYDQEVIYEAIRRELRRGGQVFYLHNSVDTITSCAYNISQAIPESRVGIGHGKMGEGELSEVWRQMLEQEINVLVCTTIIETGVDIPNANTLIIDNADHMGLSQLHQLRGRVGRSSRRAYAYFTYRPMKVLTEVSAKRLSAIEEFTEFGSGFKIAMRDLEIRGAGNVLGAQQHGHMEVVGYDMYLKLLNEAIREERGEEPAPSDIECSVDVPIPAHIPEEYIPSLKLRIAMYRRIADIRNKDDADDVIDELIDRFGDVPSAVMGLINVALIRNTASLYGIYEIKQMDTNIILYLTDVRTPKVAELLDKLTGQAMLKLDGKPRICVRMKKYTPPLKALTEIFN
ncbi:MAG: transcription-repair coupling factor [Acutalibacteraceae bacterium]|nr:transcription-repair coupling factor [Acutalibacteraceae bacterium]